MNIPVTDSYLNNSFDLVHKIKDIQVDDDYILISLDVSLLALSHYFILVLRLMKDKNRITQ